MRITEIYVSVFELPRVTRFLAPVKSRTESHKRWVAGSPGDTTEVRHVLHVRTDEGVEGVCTVGDVRYTVMPVDVRKKAPHTGGGIGSDGARRPE